MNADTADNLRQRIEELGGVRTARTADGPFVNELFDVAGVRISLEAEYGTWRANLSYAGGPLAPAPYWLAALEGTDAPPSGAAPQDALPELLDRLSDVLRRAADIAPAVEAMVRAYRYQRVTELGRETGTDRA